ncbi:hypothetical protein KP78_35010 [Jeotgalibacillus soli]|uniref:Bypass-of-forespore C N-terminal domain-containing protein n=1 Tax=Jeotgalibacillus soli TaxID=889306 RepID=A0A0C2V6E9_9BACL|nr:hypothetical protein KP78_35010 [Jeotgalibacillus soli]
MFSSTAFLIKAAVPTGPQTVEVTLITYYEDGDKAFEVNNEEILAMEDFWAKYQDWQLVDMSKGKVIFRTKTEEWSPLLELSGYSSSFY